VKLTGGDSIVFTGRLPHRILSLGAQRAKTLVIITNENELHDERKARVSIGGEKRRPSAKSSLEKLPAAPLQ
jgi:hypothetical protein